jgi:SHS2 domain-containing protein
MTWRLLDHTADLRIEGRGPTREAALEALCEGLIHELGGGVRPTQSRRLSYSGVDLTDTVVGLLGELLWTANGERWLASSCLVVWLTETGAEMSCEGAPLESGRARFTEIKAATYHDFEFVEEGGEWAVRVVFDV